MEMDKLIKLIEKELKEVGENGLTSANLETTSKLVDMYKDLKETEGGSYGMPYREGGYSMPYGEGGYREEGYREGGGGYSEGSGGGYSARGGYSNGGNYNRQYSGNYGARRYNGYDQRMRDHINRISEGAEMYEYGRERYQHGGSDDRLTDGLEKMMYAICMFVESTMEFAETPQEKEIIRKHLQKIRNM